MTESLESLLEALPVEPMAPGLPARILARLELVRAAERRRRLALDLVSIAGAVIGAAGLWPIVPGLGRLLPQAPVEAFLLWLGQVAGAPAEAIWQSLQGAAGWPGRLADSLGGAGLVALSLMVIPLLAMLRRLMPSQEGAVA